IAGADPENHRVPAAHALEVFLGTEHNGTGLEIEMAIGEPAHTIGGDLGHGGGGVGYAGGVAGGVDQPGDASCTAASAAASGGPVDGLELEQGPRDRDGAG